MVVESVRAQALSSPRASALPPTPPKLLHRPPLPVPDPTPQISNPSLPQARRLPVYRPHAHPAAPLLLLRRPPPIPGWTRAREEEETIPRALRSRHGRARAPADADAVARGQRSAHSSRSLCQTSARCRSSSRTGTKSSTGAPLSSRSRRATCACPPSSRDSTNSLSPGPRLHSSPGSSGAGCAGDSTGEAEGAAVAAGLLFYSLDKLTIRQAPFSLLHSTPPEPAGICGCTRNPHIITRTRRYPYP